MFVNIYLFIFLAILFTKGAHFTCADVNCRQTISTLFSDFQANENINTPTGRPSG